MDSDIQAKDKDVPDERDSTMRSDYLSWEDYFMGIALLAAQRSKDPRTQVGACIVSEDKKIVGIGYNGMPENINDEEAPWGREEKRPYVCHAEMNAVLFRTVVSVRGCKMYVTLFPCNECAKVIVQSGIKEVFYCTDKPEYTVSKKFLEDTNIEFTNKVSNGKRADYLSWDEYFMATAFLSAQRSKDPRTQVGACIVNSENKIVGIGYNGMPIGCSDDLLPWHRDPENILESKQLYVCHAEMNAVLNKNSADVKDCRIYVVLFPCNECAKIVIQSGIREVIYYSDKYADKDEFKASKKLLDMAGIRYRQYRPERQKIVIDFSVIESM